MTNGVRAADDALTESQAPDDSLMSNRPPTVCVFCGSSPGTSPLHLQAARDLAQVLHANGGKLVYGAGTMGIMGQVARSLVELSGPDAVHGIIPSALVKHERNKAAAADPLLDTVTENLPSEAKYGRTTVVADMHTRKQTMAKEVIEGGPGSGFVALSGGYGTMEELMEVTTWNQLGIHSRPVVVFNVDGYYDGLMQWVRNAVESGFVSESNRDIMVEAKTPEEVWQALQSYRLSDGRFNLDWSER